MKRNFRFAGVFRFLSFTEKLEHFLTQAVVAGLVVLVVSQVVLQRDSSLLFNYGDWMARSPVWNDGIEVVPAVAQQGSTSQGSFHGQRGTITLRTDPAVLAPHIEVWVNNQIVGSFRNSKVITVSVQAGDRITLLAEEGNEPVSVLVAGHSSNITAPSVGDRLSVHSGRVGFTPVRTD